MLKVPNFLKQLLKEIHASYYEYRNQGKLIEADVRRILPFLRNHILRGMKLGFSGVIPLGYDPTK